MIDLSDVVNDPDFAQAFTVTRKLGVFAVGQFTTTTTQQVPFYGIIQPASDEETQNVPEGDRTTGMMSFISTERMYQTRTDGIGGSLAALSDEVIWRGQTYTLVHTTPWGDFGFWKAIGARKSGV